MDCPRATTSSWRSRSRAPNRRNPPRCHPRRSRGRTPRSSARGPLHLRLRSHTLRGMTKRLCSLVTTTAAVATAWVTTALPAQRPDAPPAVKRYFDLARAEFSGQRAFDQVAFMDQYFRWPGNEGFNASIHRVEQTLKAAGFVDEKTAPPGAPLTYRIEHRPRQEPA